MIKIKILFKRIFDIVISPITLLMALLFKILRKGQLKNFPISKKILLSVGVLPILDHYYEPLFHPKHLRYSLDKERTLPGINYNDAEQLEILGKFNYNDELSKIPVEKGSNEKERKEYCYNIGQFNSGDGEYWYSIVRLFKPKKIIEIGSGSSTLMARNAISKNKAESDLYNCEHICIEPYEQPWLENFNIKLIREKVENINIDIFKTLEKNDILFIDSSHIIRTQGDVLYEYLEILPILNKGVIVHIHDIFTPRDYPFEWFGERLWNEQYLLESFLTCNNQYKIIGAVNYLMNNYREPLFKKCPILARQKNRKPGSFYIMKI